MARYVQAGPSAGLAVISPQSFVASNEDFFRARVMAAYDPSSTHGMAMIREALARTEATNGYAAMNAAKAVANQIRGMNGMHDFIPLHTLEQFQAAPAMMVNWMMTDPTLRGWYHRGRIEGWSDTYVDDSPNQTGMESLAYCVLNHGLIQEHADSGTFYHQFNFNRDKYPLLELMDVDLVKLAQQNLINMIQNADEGAIDPTSQYGATL